MATNIIQVKQFTKNVFGYMKDYRVGKCSFAPHSEIRDTFQEQYGGNRQHCALFHWEYYINRKKREDGLAFFFALDGNIKSPSRTNPSLDLEGKIEYSSLSFGLYQEDGRESAESSKIVVVRIGEWGRVLKTKIHKRFRTKTGFSLPLGKTYLLPLEYTIRFYATGRTDPLPE